MSLYKKVIFTIITTLCFFICILLVYAYFIRNSKLTLPLIISENQIFYPIIYSLFLTDEQKFVVDFMKQHKINVYKTLDNKYEEVNMSKKIFNKINMFGKIRYWHKPNIKKLYFWFPENDNGKDYIRFNTVYSEKLFNSLKNIGAKHLSIAEFDKYGFRKTHIKNNKKLNNILMLGDSFTEGVWVNDKENFTYFLCKKLYDENNGYVINAGVNGYGILEEFFILKKFYKKFNIKKVVLNVFVNDIENKIVEVLTGRLYNIKIKWEKYFDWLKQFNDFCLKNKIRFYLSVIPAKQQYILKNNTYENYQIMIKNFCLNNNIKFLDVYNEFTKYNADDIYIKYDDHFNIKGHKLYSEFLYKNIKD